MNEDITNNANVNDEKPFYTEAGFKAIVKQSPFNMLQRDQYEYKSADSKYYILAYHEDGLGLSIVLIMMKWLRLKAIAKEEGKIMKSHIRNLSK